MRLARSLLVGIGLWLWSGCQPAPAPSFAELQPDYLSSTNVFDAQARANLPAFEQRMDRMADAVLGRADAGELSDAERGEAGRALFYAGFLTLETNQGLYDGLLERAAVLTPRRYAPDGDERAELVGRVERSLGLMRRAD